MQEFRTYRLPIRLLRLAVRLAARSARWDNERERCDSFGRRVREAAVRLWQGACLGRP